MDIESTSFRWQNRTILFSMGSPIQIADISNDRIDPEIKRVKLTAPDFHLTLVDQMKVEIQ